MKHTLHGAASVAVAVVSFACTGTVDGNGAAPGAGAASATTGGSSATGGSGSASSGGAGGTAASGGASGGTNSGGSASGGASGGGTSSGGASSGGTSSGGTDPGAPAYLPAGVRRLTNQEYVASVAALIGDDATLPADFALPPDSRQNGFTRNQAQRVDPVLVKQLDANAQAIADSARPAFSKLAPCADTTTAGQDACAQTFIASFGKRAYRRDLAPEEKTGLHDLYTAGFTGGSYADGIALVIRAVLQAPGFIYLTELGEGTPASGSDFQLTAREIATGLAYYLTAAPPSDELLADADSGTVAVKDGDSTFHIAEPVGTSYTFGTPEAMSVWAHRLLYSAAAQAGVVRMFKEWLGVDAIVQTGKDTTVYGNWKDDYRNALDAQTVSFVSQVTGAEQGVAELFGADWTMANSLLAGPDYYDLGALPSGTPAGAFVSMPVPKYRRGILNQGAFLSVFAHASESAPVLRGAAVMKRVLCVDPGSPADLSGVTPPAPPNATQTTRERYADHAMNPKCAGCHAPIDAIGFTFEDFDGAGNYQTHEKNGLQVDASTDMTVDMNMGVSGHFDDSGDLAAALAASPEVITCFARHLFRNASAQSGAAVQPSEDSFVTEWQANPDAATGRITSSVLAYATSPLLSHRRAP